MFLGEEGDTISNVLEDGINGDDAMQELSTVKKKSLFPESQLGSKLIERLRDSITHHKHYLNPNFSTRRDWQVLRAWKAYIQREPIHIMEQLDFFSIFI